MRGHADMQARPCMRSRCITTLSEHPSYHTGVNYGFSFRVNVLVKLRRVVFHGGQEFLMVTLPSASLTSRHKSSLLCLIGAFDEAHELGHHIAVIVGRPEGVVCNCPARREDHKICGGSACTVVAL